jgi:hypothetical protein
MAVDAVVVAQYTDDAALSPGRCGFIGVALGQHDDPVSFGELQRHGEPRKSSTNDNNRSLSPIWALE